MLENIYPVLGIVIACIVFVCVLWLLAKCYSQIAVSNKKMDQRYEYQLKVKLESGEDLCLQLYSDYCYQDVNALINAYDRTKMEKSSFYYTSGGKSLMIRQKAISVIYMERKDLREG